MTFLGVTALDEQNKAYFFKHNFYAEHLLCSCLWLEKQKSLNYNVIKARCNIVHMISRKSNVFEQKFFEQLFFHAYGHKAKK